ncbi:hypothetical protein [Prosthecobacter fluviatilis]|uniref:Uncharacterized protein n=1 Tax=Prosthecobacter fluviatilis TaxID=445931 RepID=A0ABW0KMC6_9BACT
MDTPSTNRRSWNRLTQSARLASMPQGVDVRLAVRAEISAPQCRRQTASLWDDVLDLFCSRWLQAGFAALALAAFLACHHSLDVLNEMAWIWQLQGPVFAGI